MCTTTATNTHTYTLTYRFKLYVISAPVIVQEPRGRLNVNSLLRMVFFFCVLCILSPFKINLVGVDGTNNSVIH